jgi:hypothetical protein
MFPYSIPIALGLLAIGIVGRSPDLAMAASPFMSPYLTFYTYSVVQVGLLSEKVEKVIPRALLQIFLAVGLWFLMIFFGL